MVGGDKSKGWGLQKGVNEPSISTQAVQVLRLLHRFGYFPLKISKSLKKSRKNVYKHILNLTKKGFYEKFKGVTRAGFVAMGYAHGSRKFFRINGVQIFYQLPLNVEKLKWKRFVGCVLSGKKVSFEAMPFLRNRTGITDRPKRFWVFDKYDARVHANGVMVYFPSIFGETGSDAELNLLRLVQVVGGELNRIFGISFFDENSLRIRLLKYELAHLDDSVAKEFRREGRKLSVSIDGKKRVIIDFSFKVDELESVSVAYGLQDQDVLQTFFKDLLKEENRLLLPSDLRKEFAVVAEFMKRMNGFVGVQHDYNFLLQENLKEVLEIQRLILEGLNNR